MLKMQFWLLPARFVVIKDADQSIGMFMPKTAGLPYLEPEESPDHRGWWGEEIDGVLCRCTYVKENELIWR